jgi:phosphoglycolate phosphatase
MKRLLPGRIAAAIFDLDGTLLDSEGDIGAACNHMLVQAGREPLEAATIRSFVGDGARTLVARALGVEREAPEVARHLDVFLSYYSDHPLDHGRLYEGGAELLAWLGPKRTGICTNKNKDITLRILKCLGLELCAVVGGGDTRQLKPSPEPVLLTCELLGVRPDEVVFVGDSEQDVLAARSAGCFVVGVLGGLGAESRLLSSEPDWVSPNLVALGHDMRTWNFVPAL